MRSFARETVFKFIFSRLFNQNDEGLFTVLLQNGIKNGDLTVEDAEFAQDLLKFIDKNEDEYLDFIKNYSINFNFERVFNPDKCAILIGMAELSNYKNTPIPVVIDEAVKLASKYGTEKSTDFVNGILAKFTERKNG